MSVIFTLITPKFKPVYFIKTEISAPILPLMTNECKGFQNPIFILFPQEMGYTWTKSSTYMERSKEEIKRIKWEAQQRSQSARRHVIRAHTLICARMRLPAAPSGPTLQIP